MENTKSTQPMTRADSKHTIIIEEFFGNLQTNTESAAVPTDMSSTGVVGENLEAPGSALYC